MFVTIEVFPIAGVVIGGTHRIDCPLDITVHVDIYVYKIIKYNTEYRIWNIEYNEYNIVIQ